MKSIRTLTLFALTMQCIFSQVNINGNRNFLGRVDMSAATSTQPFRLETSAPSGPCFSGWVETISTGKLYRCRLGAWEEFPSGGSNIQSVFGRTGAVSASETDYQLFYPRLSTIYSDPSWISSLSMAKITGLGTALGNKEGTISTGTASQYFRGDKTWQEISDLMISENQISDLQRPVYLASSYGVIADGITDHCSNLQAAHNAVKAGGGGVLVFQGGTPQNPLVYATSCTIEWDQSYVRPQFNGYVTWAFSAPSGILLKISGTVTPTPTSLAPQILSYWKGLIIRGPGKNTPTIGIEFSYPYAPGMTNKGPAYTVMENILISQVGTCVYHGDNSYLIHFQNSVCQTANTGVIVPTTTTHTGERMTWTGGSFVSVDRPVVVEKSSVSMFFSATSFDFTQGTIADVSAGYIYFDNIHAEKNGPLINGNWFRVSGTGSLSVTNTVFAISGGGDSSPYVIYESATTDSRSGIYVCGNSYYFTNNAYPKQFLHIGPGPIYDCGSQRFNFTGLPMPTVSDQLNLVRNSDFEDSGINLQEFELSSSNTPVITSTDAYQGTSSLLLSNISSVQFRRKIRPGTTPLITFWNKTSGLSPTGAKFRVRIEYRDSRNQYLSHNHNPIQTDLTNWTLRTMWTAPAPRAADEVLITLAMIDGNGSAWIDNLCINIDGASAAERYIASGNTSQYFRGDKTWQDLPSAIRSAISASGAIAFNTSTGEITCTGCNALSIGENSGLRVADGKVFIDESVIPRYSGSTGAPQTSCSSRDFYIRTDTQQLYICPENAWQPVSSASGESSYLLIATPGAGTPSGGIDYFAHVQGSASGTALANTRSPRETAMVTSGTISNCKVRTSGIQPAGGTNGTILTLTKNGVFQSLSVSIPPNAAAGIYPFSGSATYAVDDLLSWRFRNDGGSTGAVIASISCQVNQ